MAHTNKIQERGFIQFILIVLIGLSLLWWFGADIRGSVDSPRARKMLIIKSETFIVVSWYNFLVWYDNASNTFPPLHWVQSKVNRLVGHSADAGAGTTTPSLVNDSD
jgi:hypothetical protein